MSNEVKMQLVEGAQPTIPEAPKDITVTDARGRVIGVKKPPFLAQFRLQEALGESASNEAYMGSVFPVLYVASIDGDPIKTPTTKLQVEAILQRLDEDGYIAVFRAMQEHFSATDKTLQDQVKNA
ncbi:MAG TPA: hypothetical protein VMA74_14590 [Dyella sp.]|uniref:hypothetical protein n=1 Tax=Dyella sp. TaxID=1869338 RepID=UPI002BE01E5F|nr:hypothetical protein [Dyella sp.]HUB90950.1 hypothetical protein [Dyella sp.]